MRISVLGGSGAWPTAEEPCSGFLLDHDGFLLLVDVGYAVLPALLATVAAERVDAVYVSHGHPDHCADLNPLLRARALGDATPAALAVYAPARALAGVLGLDRPGMLDAALDLREFRPGEELRIGPFEVATRLLPHWVPNAAARFAAGAKSVVYTGDGGPAAALGELADGADVLVAEATRPEHLDGEDALYLSTARHVAREAAKAQVGRLLLTHLWPGSRPAEFLAAAGREYDGPTGVAAAGTVLDV